MWPFKKGAPGTIRYPFRKEDVAYTHIWGEVKITDSRPMGDIVMPDIRVNIKTTRGYETDARLHDLSFAPIPAVDHKRPFEKGWYVCERKGEDSERYRVRYFTRESSDFKLVMFLGIDIPQEF